MVSVDKKLGSFSIKKAKKETLVRLLLRLPHPISHTLRFCGDNFVLGFLEGLEGCWFLGDGTEYGRRFPSEALFVV
jgi:hypothetical protein